MKKYAKLIVLLVVAVLSLSFLCSCDVIDELRDSRVDLSGDNLVYKGKEYIFLCDGSKALQIYSLEFDFDEYLRCYVVDKNVPLLLIQDYGESAFYSEEKDMFSFEGKYYCTDEKYDYYSDIIQKRITDCYRSCKYVVNEEKKQIFTEHFVVDKDITSAIKNTLEKGKNRFSTKEESTGWKIFSLDSCDKDRVLLNRTGVSLFVDETNRSCGIIIGMIGTDYSVKDLPQECYNAVAELYEMNNFDLAYSKIK